MKVCLFERKHNWYHSGLAWGVRAEKQRRGGEKQIFTFYLQSFVNSLYKWQIDIFHKNNFIHHPIFSNNINNHKELYWTFYHTNTKKSNKIVLENMKTIYLLHFCSQSSLASILSALLQFPYLIMLLSWNYLSKVADKPLENFYCYLLRS